MLPNFLPAEAENLSEATSIALVQKIKQATIHTSLSTQPIRTTYVNQGNGNPPILLLHGFDSSVLEFRRLQPLLARDHETWAVDLLGFGFTERVSGLPFGAEAIKTHLYHFWKTLIQKPVILLGASMGGAAALDFTLTYPEAVEKLVLLNSAGLEKPPLIGKLMFPPLDYLATEFLRYPWVRKNIMGSAYYDQSLINEDAYLCSNLHLQLSNWNQALIAFSKSGGYGSFAAQLPQIAQPTLILWGENDKILGTKAAHKFKEAIANSQLIWIKECGHLPHLEQPQISASKILKWKE